jgi:hypothetical protein
MGLHIDHVTGFVSFPRSCLFFVRSSKRSHEKVLMMPADPLRLLWFLRLAK